MVREVRRETGGRRETWGSVERCRCRIKLENGSLMLEALVGGWDSDSQEGGCVLLGGEVVSRHSHESEV